MKRIEYICPIDCIHGNISGRQDIEYNGADAYSIPDGSKVSSNNYQARLIAAGRNTFGGYKLRYFSVRTRTTVNMTNRMRLNMALMGGSGALFASLISDKTSAIYAQCVAACPAKMPLRMFIVPLLRSGLAAKNANIVIANNVSIVNPWVSSDTPNVPVTSAILDKFNSELSSNS